MTAEIAIMNQEAIALASDSAVTVTGTSNQKIFTSVNKLFTLSKYHPVGVMVYGNAALMAVPWETIVKVYRNKLGKKRFNRLKEYADDFINFLDNDKLLFPDSVQEEYVRVSMYDYFDTIIKNDIKEAVHSIFDENGQITEKATAQVVSKVIGEHHQIWERTGNIPSIPESYNDDTLHKYKEIIEEIIKEVFEELPLSERDLNRLRKIAAYLFSKFPEIIGREGLSGVVIAGFGEEDTFPSLESFDIEAVVNNRLKYQDYTSTRITFETTASIIPFAQKEMVITFMEGIDPDYRNTEESYLSELFEQYARIVSDSVENYSDEDKAKLQEKLVSVGAETTEDLIKKLEDYRHEKHISPITSVVSMLPKNELAVMAETLVNLTVFKRKVTMESETVGGPVDVALISKGDGFIWIKRKHYFQPELNPQFFANYYREV